MIENVIDTHIHVWDLDRVEYRWLEGSTTPLNRTYAIGELEEERVRAGISMGVLVQAANNREDTDWMLAVAARSEWIGGVVGWLPLEDPMATARELEGGYGLNGYLKGIRHLIHNEADPAWLLREPVLESLGLLAACDLPYDVVGVTCDHLRAALKVAERWPGLRMVLDHLNQPPIGAQRKEREWTALMKAAAEHEQMHVKISGLGTAAGKGPDWEAEDIEPWIESVFHSFGAARCFCGGDWPVCLLAGSYERIWAVYRSMVKKYLNEADQERVLSGNARRFYRLSQKTNL